jgi:hypothetical protein
LTEAESQLLPMQSSANSDHSPCSSKTKLFHIEFSDLHVSKEDFVKQWCYQLKCQLFEAEYLADEDSVFVPADVAAIVHPSQKETLRVRELRQLAKAVVVAAKDAAAMAARTKVRMSDFMAVPPLAKRRWDRLHWRNRFGAGKGATELKI